MFAIYTSTNQNDIIRGRLWRITSRRTGIVRYVLGTMHLKHNALLQAGTPELFAILDQTNLVLCERPDKRTMAEEAIPALEHVLSLPKMAEDLTRRVAMFVARNARNYRGFLDLASKNIIEFYAARHDRQIDPIQLKRLDCFALYSLATRVKSYRDELGPDEQAEYDNVFIQFCKARKQPESIIAIEPFSQHIQALYDTALSVDDQLLSELLHEIISETTLAFSVPQWVASIIAKPVESWFKHDLEMSYFGGSMPTDLGQTLLAQKFKSRNFLINNTTQTYRARGNVLEVLGHTHCVATYGVILAAINEGDIVERIFETPNLNFISNQITKLTIAYLLVTGVTLCYLDYFWLKMAVVLLTSSILIQQIRSYVQLRNALLNNCGPKFLQSEMLNRSLELYAGEQPINKLGMLHQYHQTRQTELQFVRVDDYPTQVRTANLAAPRLV